MSVRSLARPATSVDVAKRTFSFVASTETPVRTWIPDPAGAKDENGFLKSIEVDEVLSMDGIDLGRALGMPLVDAHNTFSIHAQLGSVDALQIEMLEGLGRGLTGTARFVPSQAALAEAMAEGHYRQLSIGYHVRHHDIEMREGMVPLATATDWELQEVSLCPVGADRHAQVRSSAPLYPLPTATVRALENRNTTMDIAALVTAAEAALTAADEAIAAIPVDVPEGTDAAVVERAAEVRLRALRAEGDVEKAKDGTEAAATETTEPTAEEKAETAAVEAVRSIAKSYGAEVSKVFNDLVTLGARSADLRKAVRSEVMKRGAQPAATTIAPSTRSVAGGIDYAGAMADMNKRSISKR